MRIEDGNVRHRDRRRAVEERELRDNLSTLVCDDTQSIGRQELDRHHAFQTEIAERLTGARDATRLSTFDEKTNSHRNIDEVGNDPHELLDRTPSWMQSRRVSRLGPLIAGSHL